MKAFWLFFFVILLTACHTPEAEQAQSSERLSVQNGDVEIKLEHPPERAITLNQHVTEVMLALGLEDRMIGTAYLDDNIHPDLKDAYEDIPVLAERYPSQETILEANPDFLYAGWESAFQTGAAGSRDDLKEYGITTYLHESSQTVQPNIDDVFQDIRNIGKVFQKEEEAAALIEEMRHDIEKITEDIPVNQDKKKVFVYDSGEDAPLTAGQNFLNTLIELAEAENIFHMIETGWTTVSWEKVAEKNPDDIIIIDYGDTSAEDKIQFLVDHPVMKNLDAVQEKRFTVIPLSAASEGIRAPMTLDRLITGLYE
ncbi:iron complex transport system substrate-binding protein [Alteribacillus persepolensis]|uniref:Iron complex transport system substrate-binding protein n=1 Tax=Alteribacillus persepolensis TaxID=568899 RepID=A0A1G7Z4W3_9BACI|nr:ABC transporter substrate-binding protein [Alteribacillus persepolensis]SDH03639.1 iron complex transport system substrate-binding protein [Alteribacillus persepolensis]